PYLKMAAMLPSKFYKAAKTRRIFESDDDNDSDDMQLSDGSDIRPTIPSDSRETSSDEERRYVMRYDKTQDTDDLHSTSRGTSSSSSLSRSPLRRSRSRSALSSPPRARRGRGRGRVRGGGRQRAEGRA